MKGLIWTAIIGLVAQPAAHAQTTAGPQATANPIVSSAREIFTRQSKFIAAAAEEMPADKYSYHPTPDQWSFGRILSHIAQSNNSICAMLSGAAGPPGGKASETDPKETITGAVKSSLDFCDQVLASLQDAKLGDTITFHGMQEPRARALFELTDDLEDHYSQLAIYLRLNGMTPPSAQPKK